MTHITGKISQLQQVAHMFTKNMCNILFKWTLRKTLFFGKMETSKSAFLGQILPAPN